MVWVSIPGKTGDDMKAIIVLIRNTEKGRIRTLMEVNIVESGSMGFNTESVVLLMQIAHLSAKESGQTVN